MEAATVPTIHHRHQPLCSSLHYFCPSLTVPSITYCSLFRSPPAVSSPPPSSFIRASSSSPSPPSSDPSPQNPQIFNPLPKASSFGPLLQDPQFPEAKSPEFFNPLRIAPAFATITAASAFLFLGFCRSGFITKPVATLSPIASVEEKMDEKSDLEELVESETNHMQSVFLLKLKEKIPVVHGFKKTKTDDDEAWEVLKAQVFSCSEQLELVRVGFEEILEKDLDCNKAHQDRVLEYLETVDKCKGLLKGIKMAMDRCERENGDVKQYLRFLNKVVARIRVLEGDMVGALKHFKELEQE